METSEFWRWISAQPEWSMGWWYQALVLPSSVFLGLIPWTALLAVRKIVKPHWRFVLLLGAWLPFACILPSLYVRINPIQALKRIGLTWSSTAPALHPDTVIQLINDLEQLAIVGLLGIGLILPQLMLWVLLAIPALQPLAQKLSQTVTRIATRTFGKRTSHTQGFQADLGTLTITTGQREGVIEAMRSQLCIGSTGDLRLPDPVVSRRHAQLEYRQHQLWIHDLGSRNGTYIQRRDQCMNVTSDPLKVLSGDYVVLGDPDHSSAVKLLFQHCEVAA